MIARSLNHAARLPADFLFFFFLLCRQLKLTFEEYSESDNSALPVTVTASGATGNAEGADAAAVRRPKPAHLSPLQKPSTMLAKLARGGQPPFSYKNQVSQSVSQRINAARAWPPVPHCCQTRFFLTTHFVVNWLSERAS